MRRLGTLNPPGIGAKRAIPLLIAILLSGAGRGAYGAGKCEGDSARYRVLPKTIGGPGQASTPYALPCDSMIVPAGQTTTIYGPAMVHFGPRPFAGSKIVVKGELAIEGKPGAPAYLSGSVDRTEFGYVPGSQSWDGLEVDSGASLRVSHARIFNAPTALVLFSKNVVLKDCYFRGTSGLVLPDTSLFLDPRGQTIDALDLREGKPRLARAQAAGKPAATGQPGPAPASVKKAAWITAGGIGVLAASGIAWWALAPSEKAKGHPPVEVSLDDDPKLPTDPQPVKP